MRSRRPRRRCKRGDGTIVDQFAAKSSGTLTVIGGAGLVVGSFSGGIGDAELLPLAKSGKVRHHNGDRVASSATLTMSSSAKCLKVRPGVGGNDIFEVVIDLGPVSISPSSWSWA